MSDTKRVAPVEEWWAEPTHPPSTTTNSNTTGKWRERTLELAKALREGNDEVAVQLARMYWAGDPQKSGNR